MNKTKLLELIDNNVTYHRLSENVLEQFPDVRGQIEFAIDSLLQSERALEREKCAKDALSASVVVATKGHPTYFVDGVVAEVRSQLVKAIRKQND